MTTRSVTRPKKPKRKVLIVRDVILSDYNPRLNRKRKDRLKTIVVVALTMNQIVRIADAYCKDHWPAMHIGEIREPEIPVIMAYSLVSRVER
jgi:hypothetical protein